MNTPTRSTPTVDEDLAEQARPGYGIPSQDPRPSAQSHLAPEEREREVHSTMMGGGVMVGAAAGATVGVAVAGPVGVVVGGALGGVAGALGGAAASNLVDTDEVLEKADHGQVAADTVTVSEVEKKQLRGS